MDWLTALPPQVLLAVLVLGVIVVAITLGVAIVQGRELSFWPPRLGPRPASSGPDPHGEPGAGPDGPRFDGVWESIWGWTSLHTRGRNAMGAVVNRSGTCFYLEGSIEGERLHFDALRYDSREVVEEASGYFELTDGGSAIEGTWRDGAGVNIAVAMERVRWGRGGPE